MRHVVRWEETIKDEGAKRARNHDAIWKNYTSMEVLRRLSIFWAFYPSVFPRGKRLYDMIRQYSLGTLLFLEPSYSDNIPVPSNWGIYTERNLIIGVFLLV